MFAYIHFFTYKYNNLNIKIIILCTNPMRCRMKSVSISPSDVPFIGKKRNKIDK